MIEAKKTAFIVLADSGKPGEGILHFEKATRKDALLTGIDLLGQGMNTVTIMDDNRAYTVLEFAKTTFGPT